MNPCFSASVLQQPQRCFTWRTHLIYSKASCRSPARVSQSPSHQRSGRDESSCAGADPEAKRLVVECSNARSCSTSFYKKRQIFQRPRILLTTSSAFSLVRKQTCTRQCLDLVQASHLSHNGGITSMLLSFADNVIAVHSTLSIRQHRGFQDEVGSALIVLQPLL